MTVRDLQREVTRERILTTVLELVAEPGAGDVAVPEVARRSGVSVATIYRYFPTKDALLDAAADEPARQAAGIAHGDATARGAAANPRRRQAAPTEGQIRPEEGPAYLRALWRSFEGKLPLVRRQPASETGRAMRAAPLSHVARMVRGTRRDRRASRRNRRKARASYGSRCC